MRKRGFTLAEVVIGLAIFIAAIIPLNRLTRTLTLSGSSFSRNSTSPGSTNPGNNPVVSEDYTGDMLKDFLDQTQRAGYSYLVNRVTGNSSNWNYNVVKETGNVSGCTVGQYYLQIPGSTGTDNIIVDPYDGKYKCFTQDNQKDLSGLTFNIKVTKGVAINLRTMQNSDTPYLRQYPPVYPPFLYVEANLGGDSRDQVMTPFQDPCIL